MDMVSKTCMSIFIFAFFTFLGTGLLHAQMETSAANSFFESAKSELADANLSESVLDAIKKQASENGYELKTKFYQKNQETEGVRLTMTYTYQIPILGVKNEHIIRGYVNG